MLLASPTARSAKRLEEVVAGSGGARSNGPGGGIEASTVHRMLQCVYGGRWGVVCARHAVPSSELSSLSPMPLFCAAASRYNPHKGSFTRNARNPLQADALVVDEASMLTTDLALSLLRAVRPPAHTTALGGGQHFDACHVVFVGDVDQLPSIGPSAVLAELLRSGVVPSTMLTRIFRQVSMRVDVTAAARANAIMFTIIR